MRCSFSCRVCRRRHALRCAHQWVGVSGDRRKHHGPPDLHTAVARTSGGQRDLLPARIAGLVQRIAAGQLQAGYGYVRAFHAGPARIPCAGQGSLIDSRLTKERHRQARREYVRQQPLKTGLTAALGVKFDASVSERHRVRAMRLAIRPSTAHAHFTCAPRCAKEVHLCTASLRRPAAGPDARLVTTICTASARCRQRSPHRRADLWI